MANFGNERSKNLQRLDANPYPEYPRSSKGSRGNLVDAQTYNGFVYGEFVHLDPKLMKIHQWTHDRRLEFVRHTTNIENGQQWVTLWLHDPRWAMWIYAMPEALLKVDRKRKR